jgi:Domain of unknown function (DUF5077)/Domain of unknown function (DUF3472)
MKSRILVSILIGFLFTCKNTSTASKNIDFGDNSAVEIPLAGNAFISKVAQKSSEEISEKGLTAWASKEAIISCYLKINSPGIYNFALKIKVEKNAKSSLKLKIDSKSFIISSLDIKNDVLNIGSFELLKPGYLKIDLQGQSKTGEYFAEVSDVLINASGDVKGKFTFANDPANFYWSRRGPSCHLNYTTPAGDKEYFYSELTVPIGEDKIGSYFMANGFAEGYFGIQVNSDSERRVLFSVWEPEGLEKTTLIKKGNNVTAGRFDGEGTGGQSYLKFMWKAGNTYKFLTKARPDSKGNTEYTSWFFAPEVGSWQLIATWSRPKISTYLTSFHGFLENFEPENGHLGRKANWSNQWVWLSKGTWAEVTEFKFTVDATGKNKQRMDFAAGVENGTFYLKNGGFFDTYIEPNTKFSKAASSKAPLIDFNLLP